MQSNQYLHGAARKTNPCILILFLLCLMLCCINTVLTRFATSPSLFCLCKQTSHLSHSPQQGQPRAPVNGPLRRGRPGRTAQRQRSEWHLTAQGRFVHGPAARPLPPSNPAGLPAAALRDPWQNRRRRHSGEAQPRLATCSSGPHRPGRQGRRNSRTRDGPGRAGISTSAALQPLARG